jgi:hypothetical protein
MQQRLNLFHLVAWHHGSLHFTFSVNKTEWRKKPLALQVVWLASYQHASDCRKTCEMNRSFKSSSLFYISGMVSSTWKMVSLYHNTSNDTCLHLSTLKRICLEFGWYFFFPSFLHFMLGTLESIFFLFLKNLPRH